MSAASLFGLGVAGAFLSYLLAFLIPELLRYLDENVRIVPRRLVVLFLLMALMMVAGGLVTWAVGASDIKSAVFIGIGWQGIVKGAGETGVAVAKRLQ